MENHGDQGVSGEGMPELSCEVDGVPLISTTPTVALADDVVTVGPPLSPSAEGPGALEVCA